MKQAMLSVAALAAVLSCAPAIRSTLPAPPSAQQLAELWIEPRGLPERNLFYGSGGDRLVPDPKGRYTLQKRDTGGFSTTYEVIDQAGREWAVKIGPEAQSEVASSRIVWAVGYRQPPSYYLSEWTYEESGTAPGPARLRPRTPNLKSAGFWAWQQNPFVGTRQLRGLLVLMMILNSTDLKNDNNELYEVTDARERPGRWYVVKDLGATLGETGRLFPHRNWIEGFERHGFIKGIKNGKVQFEFRGRHQELLRDITPEDVRWMCGLLDRLTPEQWNDAFRAAAYTPDLAGRFIRKLREKIRQGKSLANAG